jgi:hypothetical protein
LLKPVSLYLGRNMSVTAQTQVVVGEQPVTPVQPPDPNEMSQLSIMIKEWKTLQAETSTLKEQVREKNKRLKVMEDVILRIMKKNNIGALDLNNSGGRLLYRKTTSKGGLNAKNLSVLLSEHLKSEQKAAEAIKYITDHREARIRESLQYEKD